MPGVGGIFRRLWGKAPIPLPCRDALRGVRGVTPEVVKRAVINPVSGLTLNDRLEKHRQEVIYNIKQQLGTGLTQGRPLFHDGPPGGGEVEGNYKRPCVSCGRKRTGSVKRASMTRP